MDSEVVTSPKPRKHNPLRRWQLIANSANWRARQMGQKGDLTGEQIRRLMLDAGEQCVHCGRREWLQVDHITPISGGGDSVVANVQPLCRQCNSKKGPFGVDFRHKPPTITYNPIGAILPNDIQNKEASN